MYTNIYSISVHNHPNPETTQMFVNRKMNQPTLASPGNEILLSQKEKKKKEGEMKEGQRRKGGRKEGRKEKQTIDNVQHLG